MSETGLASQRSQVRNPLEEWIAVVTSVAVIATTAAKVAPHDADSIQLPEICIQVAQAQNAHVLEHSGSGTRVSHETGTDIMKRQPQVCAVAPIEMSQDANKK